MSEPLPIKPAAAPPSVAPPRRHALVVDDSRLQRKILTSLLKRWGYAVSEAESGDAALEMCQTERPELVISDWMMPGMSGIEFCQAFKQLNNDSYGYFILLTSKSEKREVAEGLDSGADDFLTKPVDGNELRARIMAGERIIDMQRQLTEKNKVITDTLDELQRVYDSVEKDLLQAKQLQQSLVPERCIRVEGGKISFLLRSSGHVGGDLVGYYPAGDGHLGIFSLDVSGHGISSALMTARLAGYLSSTSLDQNIALKRQADGSYRSRPLDQAIEMLNEHVLDEMETEHYFTLMLMDVDLRSGEVQVGQAGHPHPVIQRANGDIIQEGPGGFPVGLMSGVSFSSFSFQLAPGDRVLIFSDGVTECPDEDGHLLGEEGLTSMLETLKDLQGHSLLEAMLWQLGEFAGNADFPDDISGVVFQFQPEK